jgi:iron complex outermembrane receptor protein
MELAWVWESGLSLEASLGLTDARYRFFDDPLTGLDHSGNRVALAPEYTYALALQYRSPGIWASGAAGSGPAVRFFGRLEWQGLGPFYWDDGNAMSQGGYGLMNLRVGLEGQTMDAHVLATNLLDRRYEAVAFSFAGGRALAQAGEPRRIGLALTVKF